MKHSHCMAKILLSLTILIGSSLLAGNMGEEPPACVKAAALPAEWSAPPQPTSHYPANDPASPAPIITWNKNINAVSYQLEFFYKVPFFLSDTKLSRQHIYYVAAVYTNGFHAPIDEFAPEAIGNKPVYWRVRAMNLDGQPISRFSKPEPLYTSADLPRVNAPVTTAVYGEGNGQVLLYPVYSWVGNHGATQYEVEILSDPPENPSGIEPSKHRLFSLSSEICEIYDPAPRSGNKPFYWRVRGLDDDGHPVGIYSEAATFMVNPEEHWEVGIFGDSISHGGGHLSFGPADWEYSYSAYLPFPSINLSQSGDTSESMLERFDRDILPFHPHYLLIMGGSNSLRGGVPAESVIHDLQAIKEKCLQNNIKPIFLTLPPINPANIQKAFNEDTVADWPTQFRLVNEYIRTQVHVDIAAAINCPDIILPTEYGLDGLHLDVPGKKIMAETIEAAWPNIIDAADAQTADEQLETADPVPNEEPSALK